jgi:hypothetical protein
MKATDEQFVPHDGPRIETGALRVGDDWRGLFVRGDNCIAYATLTRLHAKHLRDLNTPDLTLTAGLLESMARLFELAIEGGERNT